MTLTDQDIADLQDMLARYRAQRDAERAQILRVFQGTVEGADPTLLLSTAERAALALPGFARGVVPPAAAREAVATAIASAINLPFSGYDPNLLVMLKGFIFKRLEELRPLAIGNYDWVY